MANCQHLRLADGVTSHAQAPSTEETPDLAAAAVLVDVALECYHSSNDSLRVAGGFQRSTNTRVQQIFQ